MTDCRLRWFYRRPLLWLALAACGGVAGAALGASPAWTWSAFAALGASMAGLGAAKRVPLLALVGIAVAVAAAFAARTDLALHVPEPLPPDRPATVRGIVRRVFGRSDGDRPAVLDLTAQLGLRGWVPRQGVIGVDAAGTVHPGDAVEASGLVERPRPRRNPGGIDSRFVWRGRGVSVVLRPHPEGFRVLSASSSPERQVRDQVQGAFRRTLSPRAAFIATSLLTGEPDGAPSELTGGLYRTFRDSGMLHLLVVSGSQVWLVLLPYVWLGWRVFRFRLLFWGLAALALLAYWRVTDGDASITRAAVMGLALAGGFGSARESDGLNSLGAAALLLLGLNPLELFSPGFQLSFAAVASLIVVRPALLRAVLPDDPLSPRHSIPGERAGRAVIGALTTCVAAHLATSPLLSLHFQQAPPAAVLANLVAVPFAAGLQYVAIGHALLSSLGITLLAAPTQLLADALCHVAEFFSRPPLGHAPGFPAPTAAVALAWALLVAAGTGSRPPGRVLGLTAAAWSVLLLNPLVPALPPAAPTLRALDVGQGDALLLEAPDGSRVLVDGGGWPGDGGDAGEWVVLPALRELRVPALDAVVLTHPHLDHGRGLAAVLEELPVGLLVTNGRPSKEAWYGRLLDAAQRRGVPIHTGRAGERIRLPRSSLNVLGPLAWGGTGPGAGVNDGSLVLRWDSGGARFLLCGDAGFAAEDLLAAWGDELRADVLKVGHHGSATATSAAWLARVRPRCALISCGRDNRFGHPAPSTLARLEAAGVRAYRTDDGGMLTATVSGGTVRVTPFSPEHGRG
jgi:competence protein ComEC